MKELPSGLYDLLHTAELHKRLEQLGLLDRAIWSDIDSAELHHRIAIPLAREIASFIEEAISGKKGGLLVESLNGFFNSPEALISILNIFRPLSLKRLKQIKPESPLVAPNIYPDTPLAVSALLTGYTFFVYT